MKEGSQPKLKSPDDSAVGTHSRRLCAEVNLLRSMEMNSLKKFHFQLERSLNPLKGLDVQLERSLNPLKGLDVQLERSLNPLKGLDVQLERSSNPLKGLDVQLKRLSNPLKGLDVQLERSLNPLKGLDVQLEQFGKSIVNFARILDEITKPTSTLIYDLAVGVDGLIESEYSEIVEQPIEIHCPDSPTRSLCKRVFIACGRDEEAKQIVARWVAKLGLEAIIISEQPSGARTQIEQLEMYTDNVAFAVILLTPDDVGKPKDQLGEPNFRPSQDVILGLGVLIGKHGRDRICLLYKGELELPSNINGITSMLMDDDGGWILNLIREMESVGLPVDLRKAI